MTKWILFPCLVVCLAVMSLAAADQPQSQKASPPDPELLKRGAQIYKARCLMCHTSEGKSPNPRMRFADKEWKHGDKPEQVAVVVADGVKGTAMMGFKNRLSPEDIKAVAAYILHLSQQSQ